MIFNNQAHDFPPPFYAVQVEDCTIRYEEESRVNLTKKLNTKTIKTNKEIMIIKALHRLYPCPSEGKDG